MMTPCTLDCVRTHPKDLLATCQLDAATVPSMSPRPERRSRSGAVRCVSGPGRAFAREPSAAYLTARDRSEWATARVVEDDDADTHGEVRCSASPRSRGAARNLALGLRATGFLFG